ncbi:hypothetical protein PB787_004608 [Vibrio parahaemolyticus]|nr:hypothetical protein [Vibrio parahaemolyticus]
MSLEQQVANLVDASNNLTNTVGNKIGEIDQKIIELEKTASNAVFDEMNKEIWLNCVTGNDSNAGTSTSPIKSVKRALEMVPNGGTVTIRCLGDLTNLFGKDPSLTENQNLVVNNRKKVYVDLRNHTWRIKTAQKTPWTTPNDPYYGPNQYVTSDAFSQFWILNGVIDVDFASAEHQALNSYPHPSMLAIFGVSVSFTALYGIDYNCMVPSFAVFSIDGWSATRADVNLNNCNFSGVGKMRHAGNGGVAVEDIKISRRTVTVDETFTDN